MKTPEGTLGLLLSVYAVCLIVAGVAFFALPSVWLGFYGVTSLSDLESILAQSLGGVMVGLGVICWMSRARAKRRGPLVLGMIVTSALWTIVAVRAGVLVDGYWIFWAEGIGLALATLVLVAIWHGGER